VLNENIESIAFCELNNEDEGKVTSMDKRKWPDLCFLPSLLFNDYQFSFFLSFIQSI
jgi:hypothetical protein